MNQASPRIRAAGVASTLLLAGAGSPALAQQLEAGAEAGLFQGLGASSERVGAGTAFNPSISVILDGVYANEFSGHADDPGGFEGGHSHGHGHDHGGSDGFQLRETEIAFEATIDPYFDAFATIAIEGTSEIDLEEAYFTTRALPYGLQVKAGRFLSDIGYINSQHTHEWDFVDRPLVNEHLFGDHGLQEIGAQLNWVAPTQTYLKFGTEILQGDTSGIANYVGEERAEYNEQFFVDDNGEITEGTGGSAERIRVREDLPFDDSSGPRLATIFAKWGPDLGYDHAAQFGVSAGYAESFQRMEEHSSPRVETWDGDAWFAGLDAVYKYDAGGLYGHGNWTVQGEYFYREQDVTFQNFNFDGSGNTNDWTWNPDPAEDVKYKQDGIYLQTVYGLAPRWQTGLRAEALGLTTNDAFDSRDNPVADFDRSYRYSANVTYRPSHFSYFRAQVNYNDYAAEDFGDSSEDSWHFMLQYNLSMGAHGAHPF